MDPIAASTNDKIEVDDVAQSYLLETCKWAKFISIMGFVGLGICLLAGVIMILAPKVSYSDSYYGPRSFAGMGYIYIVMALVLFYPVYALNKFANQVKNGINYWDKEQFNSGLYYLKGAFKFHGIIIIVYLALLALMIVFAIVFGLTRHVIN